MSGCEHLWNDCICEVADCRREFCFFCEQVREVTP
jgi:hypothetical protein